MFAELDPYDKKSVAEVLARVAEQRSVEAFTLAKDLARMQRNVFTRWFWRNAIREVKNLISWYADDIIQYREDDFWASA